MCRCPRRRRRKRRRAFRWQGGGAKSIGEKINGAHRKRRHNLQERVRDLVLGDVFTEPFHSAMVADELGEDRVACTTALAKLCAAGDLTLAGKDGLKKLYRRTAKLKAAHTPRAGEKLLEEIHKEIEAAKPKDD